MLVRKSFVGFIYPFFKWVEVPLVGASKGWCRNIPLLIVLPAKLNVVFSKTAGE